MADDWGSFNIGRFLRGNPEGLARFRLGRGVVGNTTYGLWAACVAGTGIVFALRNTPIIALSALGLIAGVYLIYMFATHRFADKHPDRAMLGDTEWLTWSQSQAAAKDVTVVAASPLIEEPDSPPLIARNPDIADEP